MIFPADLFQSQVGFMVRHFAVADIKDRMQDSSFSIHSFVVQPCESGRALFTNCWKASHCRGGGSKGERERKEEWGGGDTLLFCSST